MASWSSFARRARVPLGFAFAALYLALAKPTSVSILAGLALALPGLLLRAVASGYVQKNEQLATGGPYAHTRNPLYLGSLIMAAGFALAARSWWIAFVATAFFIAVYIPVIRAEEAFLRSRFAEFDDYAQKVPSLLPRFTPFGVNRGAFSLSLYRKHREYNSLMGAAAIALALLAKLIWRL